MCTVTDFLSNLFYKLDEGSASASTQSMPLSEGCFHARTCDHAKTRLDCLLKCFFFQAQNKENIKASRRWPLWGNPPVIDGFPSQRARNAGNVLIWRRHHDFARVLAFYQSFAWFFFSFDKIVYCDMHFTFNSIEFDFVNNPHGQ